MTYITGDVPVGSYDSTRLANLGIGHGAIDWGGIPVTPGNLSSIISHRRGAFI